MLPPAPSSDASRHGLRRIGNRPSRQLVAICIVAFLLSASTAHSEPWVGGQAAKIVDRAKGAYSGLANWTATIKVEQYRAENGVDNKNEYAAEERYLKRDRNVALYSKSDPQGVVRLTVQNESDRFEYVKNSSREFVRKSQPKASGRPFLWDAFNYGLREATLVRYVGRESVEGEACDILEMDFISPVVPVETKKPAPSGPPFRFSVMRFAVSPRGLLLRRTTSGTERDGAWLSESIVRYDTAATLSVAEFSTAWFQRELESALGGRPMPETTIAEFSPGETLPQTAFVTWGGKSFRVSGLAGKIVVLETWASWCGSCKSAFPYYEQVRRKLKSNPDVVFVALSFDANPAEYEKWMTANGNNYGFLFGRVDAIDTVAAMKAFRGSLPAFYIIGKDGRIVKSYTGFPYATGSPDPRLDEGLRMVGLPL